MFILNKYKSWYDNLINKNKTRTLEGYKESHHIIPRSCGGTNDKSNLIYLSAREHYIAHLLLTKCVEKKYYFKMLKAYYAMRMQNNKTLKRDYKINNRLYESKRKEYSDYLKTNNPSFRQEVKDKIRLKNLGRKSSAETIAKLKNKVVSQKTKEKIKYARQFQICSDEQRKMYSKLFSNMIWINKDGKSSRINKQDKEKYLNIGYKLGRDRSYLNEEYRNKMSIKTTEFWNRKSA